MKKLLSVILSLAAILSLAVPASAASSDFDDVTSAHWAYSSVKWCADNGIVNGVGNNKFAPNDTLTGAQFSVMLARTFYADEVAATKTANDNWYAAEMRVLENEGVYECYFPLAREITITLIEDENADLSRYQMAQMMGNTIKKLAGDVGFDVDAATAKVSDAMSDPYYAYAVVRCVNTGVLKGYDDGLFHGEDTLTRAQATAVIYRLYNLVNENGATSETAGESETKNDAAATGSTSAATGIALPEGYENMTRSDLGNEKYAEAIRVELTKLINEHRVANGLEACEEWDVLVTGATARAKELVQKFAHGRPDGRGTYTLYQELYDVGVTPSENIAKGGIPGAGVVSNQANYIFNAWKESAGHNETMLGKTFEYIGVGVYYQDGMTYSVTHFATGVHHDAVMDALAKLEN